MPVACPQYLSLICEPTLKRKRAPRKKDDPLAKKKLAYEMIFEEKNAQVVAEVKAHFALKPPPSPKEKIPEKVILHLVDLAKSAVQRRRSDYECSISQSYHAQKDKESAL